MEIVYPFRVSLPVLTILLKKYHKRPLEISKYLAASVKVEKFFISPVFLLVNKIACGDVLTLLGEVPGAREDTPPMISSLLVKNGPFA